MKQYKKRIIVLIIGLWLFVLAQNNHRIFMNKIGLYGAESVSLGLYVSIQILVALYLVGIIYYYKQKSALSWKQFLSTQISTYDHDERTYQLDVKIRETTTAIVSILILLLLFFFTLIYPYPTFTVFEVLVLIALVVTVKTLLDMYGFIYAFENDALPKLLKRQFVVTIVSLFVVLGGFFIITGMFKEERTGVRILGHEENSYTIDFGGYISHHNENTFIVDDADFTLIMDYDSFLVYVGDADSFDEKRINQGIPFYDTLTQVELIHYDTDSKQAILKVVE